MSKWYFYKVSPEMEGAWKANRTLEGYVTDSSVCGFNNLPIKVINTTRYYNPDENRGVRIPSYSEYLNDYERPYCFDSDSHRSSLSQDCECDCCNNECECYEAWCDNYEEEHYNDDENEDENEMCYITGEVRPNNPTNFTECMKFIEKYYPDEVNHNCGGHFHLSFLSMKSYVRLCTKQFYEAFCVFLYEWGKKYNINSNSPFWERISGDNDMCLKGYNAEKQIRYPEHYNPDRYYALNYCYGYKTTLEVRVFPMFKKKEIYKSAIKDTVHFIQNYLDNYEKAYPDTDSDDTQEIEINYIPTMSKTNEEIEVIV